MDDQIYSAQKNEITEHVFYSKLSKLIKDPKNREIIERISQDELRHYQLWTKYSRKEAKPHRFKILEYLILYRIFGVTFVVKLMEKQEKKAQINYVKLAEIIPQALEMEKDEEKHENALISLIDEERLKYMGSIVLGLNDALVELTGVLAGLTFALGKSSLIAATGFITGIAAALSMAASEYLSQKMERERIQTPTKAAFYTFVTYLLTVVVLIFPYLFLSQAYFALGLTLLLSVVIIGIFTYYSALTQDLDFKARFREMVLISLGIATLSFGLGVLVRLVFGIEI